MFLNISSKDEKLIIRRVVILITIITIHRLKIAYKSDHQKKPNTLRRHCGSKYFHLLSKTIENDAADHDAVAKAAVVELELRS